MRVSVFNAAIDTKKQVRPKVFCTKCENANPTGGKFCSNCENHYNKKQAL